MKIQTKRFGEIEVNNDHLIHMRDGMIGLSSLKKYVLIESPGFPLILWLQSCDDPGIAFPVIEPYFFKRDYKVNMTDADKHSISLDPENKNKIFVILTIPEGLEGMTANMRAPVVINLDKALATQVILQDKSYEVRVPAYEQFIQALSVISSDSSDEVVDESEEPSWNPVQINRVEAGVHAPV